MSEMENFGIGAAGISLEEALALDAKGHEPYVVSEVLGGAVRDNPSDTELQSRWLSYLLTRPSDASLINALDEAAKHLDEKGRQRVFAETALGLLYRAEIEQALTLIETLPEEDGYLELRVFSEALQMASRGDDFLPGHLLKFGWEKEGPFLLEKDFEGELLSSWMPCCIHELEGGVVYLSCALVGKEDPPPRGNTEIDKEVWDAAVDGPSYADLVAASDERVRFCEIGLYGDAPEGEETLHIKVHPYAPWITPKPALPVWRYHSDLVAQL
jgi:hypothetical protein